MGSLARIEELAELLGTGDPKVRRLLENARRFPDCRDGAERILLAMCAQQGVDLAVPPAFGVPEELPAEGRELGTVLRGDRPAGVYRHPDSELPGNEGVFGGSGSGKSYLVGHQVVGWIERGLCVIVFDVEDEYGLLVRLFPVGMLYVLGARYFPLALFANPVGSCLSALAWLSAVVGVLREVLFLRDGSCNLLLKVVGDMYRERGVLSGSGDYPLASEVFRELTTRKFSVSSRHAGFLETLVNRFHGLLQSFPGLNARRSVVPAQVLERSLLVRMGDLSPAESEIFSSLFLAWLMAAKEGEA